MLLSNYLTATHYEGLSKKEIKALSNKLDSADRVIAQQAVTRELIFDKLKANKIKDSLDIIEFQKKQAADKALIAAQKAALNKFKGLTNDVLLSKLDSAYEANNKP